MLLFKQLCRFTSAGEFFSWFAGFFLITASFRLYTLHSLSTLADSFEPPPFLLIARGFSSDAAISLFFATLYTYIIRPNILRFIVTAVWCLLLAGNSENILVNGANISAFMAADALQEDFIKGSALSLAVVIPAIIACVACHALFASLRFALKNRGRLIPVAGTAVISMAALFLLILPCPLGQDWMLYNAVESNLRTLFFHKEFRLLALSRQKMHEYLYPDLSGEKFISPANTRPNILLIVIESLSAGMLEKGWTPNLARLKEQGIYYRNFISPNRRTSNGMYSMLCGDYSAFLQKLDNNSFQSSVSKVAAIAKDKKPLFCLPRLLSDAGYDTVYMNPARLGYDDQGNLAKLGGFQQALGKKSFSPDHRVNGFWGLNDPAFFDNVERKIDTLAPHKAPWFLTALTVGTHEPYTVPAGYMPNIPKKKASFFYMDESLNSLLASLRAKGVLKNTLVLITSDESSMGTNPNMASPNGFLPANHGFMLVLTPEGERKQIAEVFTQPDLFISLADYIGADTSKIQFGRSIFRHYNHFRPLLMSSVYSSHLIGLLEPKKALLCKGINLDSCARYEMRSDDLFHTEFEQTVPDPQQATLFLSLVSEISSRILPFPMNTPRSKGRGIAQAPRGLRASMALVGAKAPPISPQEAKNTSPARFNRSTPQN